MGDEEYHIDLSKMDSMEQMRSVVVLLMNTVDRLSSEIEALKKENQALKDTINRLKGEQGRPKFPGTGRKANKDTSSKGRERGATRGKKGARPPVAIDRRAEVLHPRAEDLPADARLKFYKTVVVQDILLKRDNVEYTLAVYWSPSQQTTYSAELPPGHRQGGYGGNLRALVQVLKQGCNVTESGIAGLLSSLGVQISAGTISKLLLEPDEWACRERGDILRAGLQNSPYAQTDSTQSRQRGAPMKTHIVGAMHFVAYYTLGSKARLDVLRSLLGNPKEGLRVVYNQPARDLLEAFNIPQKDRLQLEALLGEGRPMGMAAFEELAKSQAPGIFCKKNSFARIKESLALGYYHTQQDFPVVDTLLSDDAPEYQKIARRAHALCWVHDARHYNKLDPWFGWHQGLLENFKGQYWTFYDKLLAYRQLGPAGRKRRKATLEGEFDTLFGQATGYDRLDRLIRRTKSNKAALLAVLDEPALPLHNNAAELAVRQIVRKRDVSLHTWSEKGTRVRDAFLTIIETAKKLDVSAIEYISDRISNRNEIPPLASLIVKAYAT